MSLHIGASAAAVASIRTTTAQRTGCPEWDTAGIARALEATQGSPGDVLAAAALAAGDPKLRLPSASGFAHHWPVNASALAPVSNNVPCPDHDQHDMPCPECKAREDADAITPEALAALKAAVLPEIAAGVARLRPRMSVPSRVPTPGDAPRLDARRTQADQETR